MATPKTIISNEDLLKVKLEISQEQAELRHEDRKKMQEYYFMVDDMKTGFALSGQSISTLQTAMDKMEKQMSEWFEKIMRKFDELPWKFVNKEEHYENRERIKSLETDLKSAKDKVQSIDVKLAGWSTWIIVIVFFIQQFLSKQIHL